MEMPWRRRSRTAPLDVQGDGPRLAPSSRPSPSQRLGHERGEQHDGDDGYREGPEEARHVAVALGDPLSQVVRQRRAESERRRREAHCARAEREIESRTE